MFSTYYLQGKVVWESLFNRGCERSVEMHSFYARKVSLLEFHVGARPKRNLSFKELMYVSKDFKDYYVTSINRVSQACVRL